MSAFDFMLVGMVLIVFQKLSDKKQSVALILVASLAVIAAIGRMFK